MKFFFLERLPSCLLRRMAFCGVLMFSGSSFDSSFWYLSSSRKNEREGEGDLSKDSLSYLRRHLRNTKVLLRSLSGRRIFYPFIHFIHSFDLSSPVNPPLRISLSLSLSLSLIKEGKEAGREGSDYLTE